MTYTELEYWSPSRCPRAKNINTIICCFLFFGIPGYSFLLYNIVLHYYDQATLILYMYNLVSTKFNLMS